MERDEHESEEEVPLEITLPWRDALWLYASLAAPRLPPRWWRLERAQRRDPKDEFAGMRLLAAAGEQEDRAAISISLYRRSYETWERALRRVGLDRQADLIATRVEPDSRLDR